MIISATVFLNSNYCHLCVILLKFLGGGPNTPNTPGSIHDGPVGFPAPSPKTMTESCSSNPNGPGSNAGPGSNKKFPIPYRYPSLLGRNLRLISSSV